MPSSASAVVIHYEEALYQVYAPLPYLYVTSAVSLSTFRNRLQALLHSTFIILIYSGRAMTLVISDTLIAHFHLFIYLLIINKHLMLF